MSPWEATRIALEAQRSMTFSVLRLLSGTRTQTAALHLDDRDVAEDRDEFVTPKPPKTVAAHQTLRVDKKRLRPKNQRSKRKGTSKSR